MEKFTKKSLVLKETTYKAKQVRLKEDLDTHVVGSNVSNITNSVMDNGKATASNNPSNTANTNTTVTLTGTTNTPNKAEIEAQLKSQNVSKMATSSNTGKVDYKYQRVAPTTTTESITFSKQEMNQFLKEIKG